MIYLDHAATSPMAPEVAAAMAEWAGVPANPSSIHVAGRRAAAALDQARIEVARLLERDPAGLVFVSGATEGNHLAIRGVAPRRVAVSALEHPSVHAAVAATGAEVVALAVGAGGVVVVPGGLDVDLVALQWVNHELGTVQPVHGLRAVAGRAWVHVDAAQAAGRVPLSGVDADSVVVSAHKLGGPVGVGAVSLRDGRPFPALFGGTQERGRRGGTPDVAGAVGFATAARLAREQLDERTTRIAALADHLRAGLAALGADKVGEGGVPHVTTVVFAGIRGETLVQALDLRGVCTSSGAACASGSTGPSPVLEAIGHREPRGGLRISLGPTTTAADVEAVLAALAEVVPQVRAAAELLGDS